MVNKLSLVALLSLLCISIQSEPIVKKLDGKEIVHKDGGSGSSSADEEEEDYENQEIEEQDIVVEEQRLKSAPG